MNNNKREIVKRYTHNPILTKDDIPYPVVTVHNAGVIKAEDNYIMLFRSHLYNGRSIIGLAESNNGINFKVSQEPFITPVNEGIFKDYEEFGVEDPRIVKINDDFFAVFSFFIWSSGLLRPFL